MSVHQCLVPLPAVLGTVFLCSFTFTQELDTGAVHQQAQGRGLGLLLVGLFVFLCSDFRRISVYNRSICVKESRQTTESVLCKWV